MLFFIDIEDDSGNKLGQGPVFTATEWRHVARLSRAGSISFSLPASDPRAALIETKRVARCYTVVNGQVVEVGAGIIDSVTLQEGGIETALTVDGDDLLRELTYRPVLFLSVSGAAEGAPTAVVHIASTVTNLTNAYDGNDGTFNTVVALQTGEYIYVRRPVPFSSVRWVLGTQKNGTATALQAQYFAVWGGWESISLTDGTDSGGTTLAQNGTVSWTQPADWQKDTADLYTMRFYVGANLTAVDFAEAYVSVPDISATDVSDVMALAPSGWTLAGSPYYSDTADGTRVDFEGETVLAALVKISELSGEQFRIGDGREVEWLRTDTEASGIRATNYVADGVAAESNPNICLIESFEEVRDSYQQASRIYVYGKDWLPTLAFATAVMPSGYTMNAAQGYIEKTGATPTIHRVMQFEVDYPEDTSAESLELMSNELARAGLAWLQDFSEVQTFYRLSITRLQAVLKPAETLRVQYRKIVDGYVVADIDADFVILEAETAVDANGIRTVGLSVASVSRWPQSDSEIIAEKL